MQIQTIKTHKIKPREPIFGILDQYLPKISEKTVIAIASKIISISENRSMPKTKNKLKLIKQEADRCFNAPQKQLGFCLTLKNHRLIPNAGIDESNCANCYVLLPHNPQLSAKKIWQYLRNKLNLNKLGIIITDSNVTPLRTGVTGITIGWCGFAPIYSYLGKKDIFGRKLQATKINLLDALATTATLIMGEGQEQTPLVVIKNLPQKIVFQNRAPTKKEQQSIYIDQKQDLFSGVITYA